MIDRIDGEQAALYKVIRVDSLADAHTGTLVAADVTDGTFSWRDKTNEIKSMGLEPRSIRIVRK